MCQSFQRHIEAAVPCDCLGSVAGEQGANLADLGGGVLPHVSWLIELPHLCLWDLVVGGGDDRLGHIGVDSVVADVFVGEFVFLNAEIGVEG